MTTVSGNPLRTVIHRLRPVKETEPGYWKLRWKLLKHGRKGQGTWNIYWSRSYRQYRPLGLSCKFSLPQDGWQYGRTNNCFSVNLGLWCGELEFWVKWGFIASTREHGDGVDGIDLKSWGITK